MVSDSRLLDAQYAVLGSMLIEERCIPAVMGALRLGDFGDSQSRAVFAAMQSLFESGERVDPVTVVSKLQGLGEDVRRFVLELMEITPTATAVMAYVSLVKEGARLVALRALAEELRGADSLDAGRRLLDQANELFVGRGKLRRMNMEDMLTNFYERHSKEHRYLSFGLPKLDKGVFAEAGDFLVIGGYPSSGKTALSVGFAYHLAKDLRVGFYSLETSQYKLADRLVSHLTKLSMSVIKRGAFTEAEWETVTAQHKEIPKRQLELIEAGGMTAAEIRADALAHRFDCVLVDYLQLIRTERRGTRAEEVAEISRSLHTMSQRDKITVIALSQLSRPERTKGGAALAPTMRDLRESGQIEQDADAVLLLYEADTESRERRCLKIAKNKEGQLGKILLDFDGATQTFTESKSEGQSVAAYYSDVGRKVQQLSRAVGDGQTNLVPLLGEDVGMPF